MVASDRAELVAVAADEALQDVGPADAPAPLTVSPGFVKAVHPDSGIDVVYVPGEALPAWVVAALGTATYDPDSGVITLGGGAS